MDKPKVQKLVKEKWSCTEEVAYFLTAQSLCKKRDCCFYQGQTPSELSSSHS